MGAVIWVGKAWLGNDLVTLIVILIFVGFVHRVLDFFGDKNSSII
jgi:hypothetical protein